MISCFLCLVFGAYLSLPVRKISTSKNLIPLSIILVFANLNCFLHHANIVGDGYGLRTIFDFESASKKQIPVRIEFDPNAKENMQAYLRKKGQNLKVDLDLIETYHSDEIVSRFRSEKFFNYTPNANIKIRITPTIDEVKFPVLTAAGCFMTGCIIPMLTRSYGSIEFTVFDTEKNNQLRNYKYSIAHRYLYGISPVVLGPILPSFSERFDHSSSARSFAVMRVSYNQFFIDFMNDLNSDKELLARFFIQKTNNFALFLEPDAKNTDSKTADWLLVNLEKGFVDSKLSLVERRKIKRIIEEIRLSQVGLTEQNRLQFGKLLSANNLIAVSHISLHPDENNSGKLELSFYIRCIDVESGRILWSETVSSKSKKPGTDLVKDTVESLILELRWKGIL